VRRNAEQSVTIFSGEPIFFLWNLVRLLQSTYMISLLNPILAQAAAPPEEITAGTVISAILFMMSAAGSMAMIVVWIIRYSQTGNALPASERGLLRVPWPLTFVGVALSVLFMLLMLLGSVAETNNVASNVAVSATADGQGESPNSTEQPGPLDQTVLAEPQNATDKSDDTAASDSERASSISPERMKDALVQTIVMDLLMLLIFGTVVLLASQAGRVSLKQSQTEDHQVSVGQAAMPRQAVRTADTGMRFRLQWPDLDDASAIPKIPGYDILGNRVESVPESTQQERSDEFTSPQQELPLDDRNPYAATEEPAQLQAVPEDAFSFLRELRFAAEVFLAAYLPTAVLKLIIVLISVSIIGEPPKSHPFLEMLDAGVSISMIATILIMAVFVAPIVEELQFRVIVLGGIAQLGWPKLALFGSSILFAFAHGFPDSIALIPLAIGLGYTYLRRRSYVTVMLVHFLFNAFNMVLALVGLL
jgi:membrane protease YdiL (CAAX protease family)